MATYVTSQTLTPIEGGTRIQPIYESHSLNAQTGDHIAIGDRTEVGNTGRMTTLLMGSRSPQISSYEAVGYMGSAISVDSSDPNRTYELLKEYGIGTREMAMTPDHLIIEQRVAGNRINPIRSGVGSFGIQYQQTIIQNGDKRIRRWPRDWHGDNMKD
jgi:hypothetical protein